MYILSTVLKVNQDALETAKKNYIEYANRMEEQRNKLKTAVDDIRDAWKSDGGDEFFKKFDEEWLKNFDDYIAVINHMANNIQIAKNKYQPIFDEADKLNLT